MFLAPFASRSISTSHELHRKVTKFAIDLYVEEVVVTHKDRLCRFAFELVEWIFVKHDIRVVVLSSDVDDTESSELAEDLLSIVTIFTVRHNGLRSAENRKRRREIENTKDTDLSNARRKRKAKKVDGWTYNKVLEMVQDDGITDMSVIR